MLKGTVLTVITRDVVTPSMATLSCQGSMPRSLMIVNDHQLVMHSIDSTGITPKVEERLKFSMVKIRHCPR